MALPSYRGIAVHFKTRACLAGSGTHQASLDAYAGRGVRSTVRAQLSSENPLAAAPTARNPARRGPLGGLPAGARIA